MSYHAFANGELLTAQKVNDYLMRQVVVKVANHTERDAIPTPDEGMLVYCRADDTLEFHNGSAWGVYPPVAVKNVVALGATASQNLTTSAAALAWDVELTDPAGMHDNVTNNTRVVCKSAGTYEVSAYVFNSNTSGFGTLQARLNGTTDIPGSIARRDASASAALPLQIVFPIVLALNDYIEIMVLHSTAAGNIAGGTTLGGRRLLMKKVD